LYLQEIEEII